MHLQQWLQKLISFDTTSRNSNLSLINFVKDYLQNEGFDIRLTKDAAQQKANLFATYPADKQEGGLILSGHTDVVPIDGQKWESDPFQLREKDGLLYGRGTTDMKGFLAASLAIIPEVKKLKLKRPLHLAFSYDEEVGCKGAPFIIEDLIAAGIKPSACIVGEPTNLAPVIAHKGINGFEITFHGLAAHSSLTPQGCNAIDYAACAIVRIRGLAEKLKSQTQDAMFDVAYTSISTNMIRGGIAENIIPAECAFHFEFRNLPNVDPSSIIKAVQKIIDEEVLPQMQKEFRDAKIVVTSTGSVPAFESRDNPEFVNLMQKLCAQPIRKVAYATEAGLFQRAGITTVVCGPGSIQQAHKPNEYIEKSQLEKCERLLISVVREYLL